MALYIGGLTQWYRIIIENCDREDIIMGLAVGQQKALAHAEAYY